MQDFGAPGGANSLKGQALGVITAVSYMRSAFGGGAHAAACRLLPRRPPATHALTWAPRLRAVPLTVINSVVIFVKLIFG